MLLPSSILRKLTKRISRELHAYADNAEPTVLSPPAFRLGVSGDQVLTTSRWQSRNRLLPIPVWLPITKEGVGKQSPEAAKVGTHTI